MNRYVLKFYKEGYIKYTSHLDMLRLFKRSFKRVGIKLQYSQGFNPHPKLSFAQPLSLGYSSSSEYLEFDTVESYSITDITNKLNSVMPDGVGILSCIELAQNGKTLAALTEFGEYEILIPIQNQFDLAKAIDNYITQEHILINKIQRKSGKEVELDIRPMICSMKGEVNDNYITLTIKIHAGSVSNLNPELVVSTFCKFIGIGYERSSIDIKRTGIFFVNDIMNV